MVHSAPSLTFDFGSELPKFPNLNHLDLRTSGVLTLDGRLPGSLWVVRLGGKNIAGTLKCCGNIEHLSLHFPEANESELGNFVRHAKGVKFLDLSVTPICDAFVKDLVSRWPLEYLNVSGTKVSEELVTQLVQLRPKLRVAHRGKVTRGGSVTPPSGL
jgi:hypothetical protein